MNEKEMTTFYDELTERELEILRLKTQRRTNREIANELSLAYNTIRWYITEIYSKLDVNNREEAIERANELGLFEEKDALELTAFATHEQDGNQLALLLRTSDGWMVADFPAEVRFVPLASLQSVENLGNAITLSLGDGVKTA